MKKIVFPEGNNEFIKQAADQLSTICEPIFLNNDLDTAAKMLKNHEADAMIAGIDYSSRDVILATRDTIGLSENQKTFSSLFYYEFPDGTHLITSDGATCKNPTAEQLADIIILVHAAAKKLLSDKPKIAILSFSTFGSGGKDPFIDKTAEAIQIVRSKNPDILVDGEMQLDAAMNPRIGKKKSPDSQVAGQANVLITPDINSGNILYKSLEHFAKATVAGPILLGFDAPVSDLSRGSTSEDILLTTRALLSLIDSEQ